MYPYIKILENSLKTLFSLKDTQSIIASIKSERAYQEKMWNADTTSTKGKHSHLEFYVFMRSYLNEAIDLLSRNPEPEASQKASHIIRKIAAMSLACCEQNIRYTTILNMKRIHSKSPRNINECVGLLDYLISDAIRASYTNRCEDFNYHQRIMTCCAQGMQASQLFPRR